MRRQAQSQSQTRIDQSDDDGTNSSPSQILERVQSDRVTLTKPEEDRRRRTIIVEKKNGSFGFTIQSYGIHYKKEKEIEMITYVDYVDYDGPAYRAGMREGDVILSINGTDMEKADHKTLVNYIKNCETRMRMVVLFEDCVRKVELHMRYIKLQSILECKMEELERLCIRERQLLEGKWKTHSLPARKKASQSNNSGPPTPTQTSSYSYCRPTVSTEDVAKVAQQQKHQTPPLVFAYQYLDSNYRYMLQPSTSSSGEYLLSFEPQTRSYNEQPNFVIKAPGELPPKHQNSSTNPSRTPAPYQNQNSSKPNNSVEKHRPCHSYGGQLCNPCLQSTNSNNGDNTSLEAYDLASPCCDPHCVPSRRRRSRKDQQHRKRESKTEETQTDPQPSNRARSNAYSSTHSNVQHQQAQIYNSAPKRYFHFGAGLVSQCSLHSCTSSEISNVVPTTTGESSNNSYTTSLSTDTLYWDEVNNSSSTRKLTSSGTNKGNKHEHQGYSVPHQPCSYSETVYVQYNPPAKPKSWDNLTTKAFGGYGFGYGYFDSSSSNKCGQKSSKINGGTNRAQTIQYVRVDSTTSSNKHNGTTTSSSNNSISIGSTNQPQYTPHTQRRYFQQNKSTESLLSLPKYSNEALSDSSISCECIEAASPLPDVSDGRFFQSPRQSVVSPTDPNFGYYSAARNAARSDYAKKVVSTSSEATRL